MPASQCRNGYRDAERPEHDPVITVRRASRYTRPNWNPGTVSQLAQRSVVDDPPSWGWAVAVASGDLRRLL